MHWPRLPQLLSALATTVVLTSGLTSSCQPIAASPDEQTGPAVQVDHRYPLLLAWQHGAQHWTESRRHAFAVDPANLIAVSGDANQDKRADGPADWLPPRQATRCDYIAGLVGTAAKWRLSLDPDDIATSRRILNGCKHPASGLAQLERIQPDQTHYTPGYHRARFLDNWPHIGPGCTLRDRVLARDLDHVRYDHGGCRVVAGTLHDPYTGRDVPYRD